jgi:hypothetical protein
LTETEKGFPQKKIKIFLFWRMIGEGVCRAVHSLVAKNPAEQLFDRGVFRLAGLGGRKSGGDP